METSTPSPHTVQVGKKRIHVELPTDLIDSAKLIAAQGGRNLTGYIFWLLVEDRKRVRMGMPNLGSPQGH